MKALLHPLTSRNIEHYFYPSTFGGVDCRFRSWACQTMTTLCKPRISLGPRGGGTNPLHLRGPTIISFSLHLSPLLIIYYT